MRVQLIAVGSTGDVQPMIALGRELLSRGHAVTLVAFGAFETPAKAAGLSFVALPGDAAHYIGTLIPPGASPVTYLSRLLSALDGVVVPILDTIYRVCQGADAVVCTFIGSTIYSIAEKLHVPLAVVCYCPMDMSGDYSLPILRQASLGRAYNRATYRLANLMIGMVEKQFTRPWCAANGIKARPARTRPDYRVSGRPAPVLHAYSPLVVTRPAEWPENLRVTGFWMDDEPSFTPPESLTAFLDAGDAPVYIGFGSMTSGDMDEAGRAALDALARTGLRAVLCAGWGGMGGENLPDSVYPITEYVPHEWLFPRMRAVVHHGGAGTTAIGLKAGRPSLIVPFGSDQHFWASRVHALGCGPKPLSRTKLTGDLLAAALDELVRMPAYAWRAAMLREELLPEHGTKEAADIIERMVGISCEIP